MAIDPIDHVQEAEENPDVLVARHVQKISVCCLTAGPIQRVATILALYRPIADEIICAVNSHFAAEELACLSGVADRIIPVEMREDFLQERYRAWLYAQCTGEWIITTDSDEVPSVALRRALPRLAQTTDVVTYLTTVRWSYPDVEHWLAEYPWEPSWKLVMARNDPATLYIKGGVHEGVFPTEPCRYLDLPIYHLDTAITPIAARKDKVAFYDSVPGVQVNEDGTPVSELYYLPELHSRYAPESADQEDLATLRAVAEAALPAERVLDHYAAHSPGETQLPGTVTYEEVLQYWLEHPFGEGAYHASIQLRSRARTPFRDLSRIAPGEIRPLIAIVRNDGDEVWLRARRNGVSISSKWFAGPSPDFNGPALQEGSRSAFTANVHPGQEFLQPLTVEAPAVPGIYTLLIDLVDEQVRWFGCGIATAVEVVTQR